MEQVIQKAAVGKAQRVEKWKNWSERERKGGGKRKTGEKDGNRIEGRRKGKQNSDRKK